MDNKQTDRILQPKWRRFHSNTDHKTTLRSLTNNCTCAYHGDCIPPLSNSVIEHYMPIDGANDTSKYDMSKCECQWTGGSVKCIISIKTKAQENISEDKEKITYKGINIAGKIRTFLHE